MANLYDAVAASAEASRVPIISELWYEGEVLGIHSLPEQYKTFLMLNLAEAIARGGEFLGRRVPRPRRVYLFEGDMPLSEFYGRLKQMDAARPLPWDNLRATTQEELKCFRRCSSLEAKFDLLSAWIDREQPDVALLDSTNQFFRGGADPNEERAVGAFFDRMNLLRVQGVAFIRHDKKPSRFEPDAPTAQRIRGSGVWADASDVLLSPHRLDRRTQQVKVAFTKVRNRQVGDDPLLWLDRVSLRLCLDPIRAIQESFSGTTMSRRELVTELDRRFSLTQKPADELLQRAGMASERRGHELVYKLPVVTTRTLPTLSGGRELERV